MNKSRSIVTIVSALDHTVLFPFAQKRFSCLSLNMVISSTSSSYERQVFHLGFTLVMISCAMC